MGRAAVFEAEVLLDAAAVLVCEGGPTALKVSRLAKQVGAPSGSIYHRFASRDVLAGSLWLRAVERFQAECLPQPGYDDPRATALGTAQKVLAWTRCNLDDARVLLLYRSSDLLGKGWPDQLVKRNDQQRRQGARAIVDLGARLGANSVEDRRRVRFVVSELPVGAVRPALVRGKRPAPELDEIVGDAARAVIDKIGSVHP